ncbi:MAG: hypothetical protein JXR68_06265, partial [Bacteroidales bacterium]|nr:hypothetical protein [Bacteroidales bacterium]
PEGKVTVLDIDTVQISNNGSVMFPSKAMTPEYIPPEIKKIQNGDKVPVEWDRFILSLIFYEVLFGIHPYAGNGFKAPYTNSTTIKDNISNGLFPFGQKSQYFNNIPKPHLNFKNIPLKVQNLFINSFEVDISNTHKRPTAEEWGKTLYTMIKEGQQLAAQKNIVEEQQREKDWQNCNKNSIQSLLEFRKKYNNQGKYTQKALQLINDIRTKNNQSTSNTAVTTKPTTQTQTTNTSYSNSELKKRVNRSLTYSILFLIIPNIIINLFFMIIYGEFELKWLFFSTISLNLPNLVLKITAIFAIIFSGIAKSRYNNYNYSKCEKPLKTAKVFKWITIILTGLYVILRMID